VANLRNIIAGEYFFLSEQETKDENKTLPDGTNILNYCSKFNLSLG
jgi:hypothetical protein